MAKCKQKQKQMIKKQRNLLVYFMLLFLFYACSPAQRFTRLVNKHPYLIQTDTITKIDTVRVEIPKTEIDTVFKIDQLHDTVYIEKERLKIKMYTVHDSIYVDAKCDTIFVEKVIERKIPVKYYEKKQHWFDQVKSWLKWFLILFLVLSGIYFILKLTK